MVADDYLSQLNPAQRAAVEYLNGPELVIAGAGSGKTRVLTYKIVHLLKLGYEPYRILALTFTNKAAKEMRERISALVGEETSSQLWMGTFHSIFSRILRKNADRIGYKSNFTIYDTSDSKSLIRTIIKELKLDEKYYRPGQIASDISWAKNQLISPEAYAADSELVESDRSARRERTCDIYRIYRDRCRVAGAMDFDDLLYLTNVLLRDNPDVLERYRGFFRYILVDEYQDTNFAQHLIVRQLCGSRDAVCVVGDDAQSIYSFRGANIRNILDLEKSFPALKIFKLEENYRSTRNIIGAANSLIAANKDQIRKEVYSNKNDGDRIEVVQAYNDYEEANTIAARVLQIKRMLDLRYSDIAVLYRTNAQSRVLEEALRNRNIPYHIYGGLAFYQRKEIKDAVSYFRLSVNPDDDEALSRVINTPKRGIGDTTVAKVRTAAIDSGVSMYAVLCNPELYNLSVNKGTAAKLNSFAALISSTITFGTGHVADETAAYIIEQTGLLAEYVSGNTPECISKRENLMELISGVKSFTQNRFDAGESATMNDYLAEISLMTDQDDEEASAESIVLMTIHAAKGLEFEAVFVAGVEENLLPSEKCKTAAEVEEERRLLYVAITRAKLFCMLSYAIRRMINGDTRQCIPSRFIQDVSSRYLRPMQGTSLKEKHKNQPSVSHIEPARTERKTFSKPEEAKVHPTIGALPTESSSDTDTEFTTHTSAELSCGQRIMHKPFGLGVVLEIDTTRPDHRIIVNFSNSGKRTLLLKFARFKLLS